jgi:hypothetical protein
MINTFSSAIVSFAVVLIVIGAVVGLALGQSELVNPFSSYSQLERDQVETKYLEQQHQIDIEFYAQSKQAELDAQVEQHQQALVLAAERQRHELAQAEQREQVVNSVLGVALVAIPLAVLITSVAGAYYLVCAGRRQQTVAQTSVAPIANKPNASQYKIMREAARQREREERQHEIDSQKRMQELFGIPICPNGHGSESTLPTELAVSWREHNYR